MPKNSPLFRHLYVASVMPFSGEFDGVLATMKMACEELELNCIRGDEIFKFSAFMNDVEQLIAQAWIVIADLSGQNANVMYEIGLAICQGKLFVPIAQRQEDIPSDMKHLRALLYDNSKKGLAKLRVGLRSRLDELMSHLPAEVVGPKLWGLNSPNNLHFCIATSAIVNTGAPSVPVRKKAGGYWRAVTGRGQALALTEAVRVLSRFYPQVNPGDLSFFSSEEASRHVLQGDLVLLGSPKTNHQTKKLLDDFNQLLSTNAKVLRSMGVELTRIDMIPDEEKGPKSAPLEVELKNGGRTVTLEREIEGDPQYYLRIGAPLRTDAGIPIVIRDHNALYSLVRRYATPWDHADSFKIVCETTPLKGARKNKKTEYHSSLDNGKVTEDYGLIIRIPNFRNPKKATTVLMFAGNHTHGTEAAVNWFTDVLFSDLDHSEVDQLMDQKMALVAVVRCDVINGHFQTPRLCKPWWVFNTEPLWNNAHGNH